MPALYRDPVGWSKGIVGSRPRFGFWLTMQIVFAAFVCCVVYIDRSPFWYIIGIVAVLAAFIPVMYLYALHKLVERIAELEQEATADSSFRSE